MKITLDTLIGLCVFGMLYITLMLHSWPFEAAMSVSIGVGLMTYSVWSITRNWLASLFN